MIKLDEWGGLAAGDEATCEAYLRRHLLGPLGVTPDRYTGFRVDAPDPAAECDAVASALDERGPVDVAVLGLGVNGHLGFNEPAPAPAGAPARGEAQRRVAGTPDGPRREGGAARTG